MFLLIHTCVFKRALPIQAFGACLIEQHGRLVLLYKLFLSILYDEKKTVLTITTTRLMRFDMVHTQQKITEDDCLALLVHHNIMETHPSSDPRKFRQIHMALGGIGFLPVPLGV
jgi:hypothetical protein